MPVSKRYWLRWYGATFGPLTEDSMLERFAMFGVGPGTYDSAMVREEHSDQWLPAAEHPKFACAFEPKPSALQRLWRVVSDAVWRLSRPRP